MERAYIYARYSSDRQTEQSIEGQLNVCKEFAKQNKIQIVDTFIDRALSAKTDNRPAFQHMIKLANKKLVNYILVYKLDRFARNRYDSAIYKAQLKKNGIRILSATETISNNPEGIILEGMLESMAEYYSIELAQKVKRGMRETIKKGKYTGGVVLYGFKIENGYYKIAEEQANVVRSIFNDYNSGKTITSIVKSLNASGIKNNLNKPFIDTYIPKILTNKKYIGIREYEGKEYNNLPAIVDEKIFKQANIKLSKNKRVVTKNNIVEPYFLTAKLFCGCCNKNMVASSGTSHTKNVYKYYKCYNKKCKTNQISKNLLEESIFKDALKILNDEELLKTIADGSAKAQQKYLKDDSRLKLLKAEYAEKQKATNNILKAIEQGIITSQTKTRLETLENEVAELDYKIAEEQTKKTSALTKEEVFLSLKSLLENTKNKKFKEIILESFVNKVIFYDKEHIEVYYNFKNKIDGSNRRSMVKHRCSYSNLSIVFYKDCFMLQSKK